MNPFYRKEVVMKLNDLYSKLAEIISNLDYESIWYGFKPLKFALYDDENCFFDGSYIEKTDAFCANTSVSYNGEKIAIWKVDGEIKTTVLASKIVHEMFHGYQTVQGWNCSANEMEALCRYEYSAENLTLKLRENDLLLSLLDGSDEAALRELMAHRKLRSEIYPYEYSYESKVEEIEGTATYVEWMVLKQLDEPEAKALTNRMRTVMTKPECLFPIRISGYYTGALMINALSSAGIYPFAADDRPVGVSALKAVTPSDGGFPGKEVLFRNVSDAVDAFNKKSEEIIRSVLERNEVVLNGPLELVCVNIYDARFYKGYITSRYFLLYRDEAGEKTIYGNYVIKLSDDKTISCVYRWDESLTPQYCPVKRTGPKKTDN